MRLGSFSRLLFAVVAVGTFSSSVETADAQRIHPATAASAAWSMVGYDIQRSDRSPVVVRRPYHPLWKGPHLAGPSLSDSVGRIFGWGRTSVDAIASNGKVIWSFPSREYDGGPPVLNGKGDLVVEGFPSTTVDPSLVLLYKLSRSTGHLVSQLEPDAFSKGAAPLFNKGKVYVPFVGPSQTNAKLWSITNSGKVSTVQPGFTFDSIAMSRGVDLFAIGRYSGESEQLSVERLTPDGKVAWTHVLPLTDSNLAVGGDAVYVVSGDEVNYDPGKRTILTAYAFNGQVKWSVNLSEGEGSLAIRPDGSIIVAGQLAIAGISKAGRIQWTRALPESIYAAPTIALDGSETAFVGTGVGTVAVISKHGKLIRRLRVGPKRKYLPVQVAISTKGICS